MLKEWRKNETIKKGNIKLEYSQFFLDIPMINLRPDTRELRQSQGLRSLRAYAHWGARRGIARAI
jgi:hypothetical protein